MKTGEEFYSKNLKRVVQPGEEIYLYELKKSLLENISFYRNAGCGAAGCIAEELTLRNELDSVNILLNMERRD